MELTDFERTMGVTQEGIDRAMAGMTTTLFGLIVLPEETSPANAHAAIKRFAEGANFEFSHLVLGKYPAYRLTN